MSLFGDTTQVKKEPTKKKTATVKKNFAAKESKLAGKILYRPRVTEKSYTLNALNQYVFVVTKEATKKTIKQAVEEVYGVQVLHVRIVHLPMKKRMFGKNRGFRSAVKKAIVSIAKGQTIELFKSGM